LEPSICYPGFLHLSVVELFECQVSFHPARQPAHRLCVQLYEPIPDLYLWC
jgi:hypothetical protein